MNKTNQGKKNRIAGKAFELKVRKDLEEKGWIISKWCNNLKCIGIDYIMIPAKSQYNPFFKRIVGEGSGFPDFIVFQKSCDIRNFIPDARMLLIDQDALPATTHDKYLIIGIECKINGRLDKAEKGKCEWLIQNNIFSKILIARKGLKRGEILYEEWKS